MHRIEVALKSHLPDPRGLGLVKDIHDLGIRSVNGARVEDLYWLDASLTDAQLDSIGRDLLADPLTQDYRCFTIGAQDGLPGKSDRQSHVIEVAYNAGVTDPVEATVTKAISDLGIGGVRAAKSVTRYILSGRLTRSQRATIIQRLLVNPIVQHTVEAGRFVFPESPQYAFHLKQVDILGGNPAVLREVKELGFDDAELAAVIAHFGKLGRNPTDVELETLAQTWSEHCVHKTFKGRIRYDGSTINNLLKSTVMRATQELAKPWCLSVFEDNSGVIDFDGRYALCFKVETHNHPSAVEPYGGAATGIGGVIRDPLGTGLGSKPILNTDVFCFAPPDYPYEKLPKGVLHPRRIFKGVRAGVADYGNRMGIPTLNGAVLFDERYLANPLVFCGTVGLMPREHYRRGQQQPGDLVVVAGGRTGRDGIHGVTFASVQLTDESGTSAVQIGNPIVEKRLIDVLLPARDRGLYRRITDCGGGGLSSAVGEMGADTGVQVNLDKVPLKYSGLSYSEIWVSESQERMVLAVPPEKIGELLSLFAIENVEAAVIGQFTGDGHLRLFYQGNQVGDLDMTFLHHGYPQVHREAVWQPKTLPEPDFTPPDDLTNSLLKVLGSWNVCSKEWVVRQYDHEVQGGSVLKPLVGRNNDGPGDAAVVRPLLESDRGVIIANGIKPAYGDIDPYWMAASAIDEALRQVIAVGGSLDRVALLDNFCWGNTDRPEMMGALVRAAQACYDMAVAYGTPFISGKDSLNNEFQSDGKTIVIPHTLLVSAIGVMEDVGKAVSMDFKGAGDLVYIVGVTGNELGGSEYLRLHGLTGNSVPGVDPKPAKELMDRLSRAMDRGLVRACHDCSDGGLGVAVAEMAFAGGLGATVRLSAVPPAGAMDRDDFILFSESNSRFLVEIAPDNRAEFEEVMNGTSFACIGEVTDPDRLVVYGRSRQVVDASLAELKEAWQKPLRW